MNCKVTHKTNSVKIIHYYYIIVTYFSGILYVSYIYKKYVESNEESKIIKLFHITKAVLKNKK